MNECATQRSNAWFLNRRGKITASECYLLLANHKEPMSDEELAAYKAANPKSRLTTKEVPFSEGTYTYLNKKVAEYYMTDNSFLEYVEMSQTHNRATDWGTLWESDARKRYAEVTGYEVMEVGFIPMKGYERFFGGSPDGYVRYEDVIIEIKSPFNPEVHQDYLLFETPADLFDVKPQYYVQMQANMLVTDTSFGDFISFDPRTSRSRQLKVLRVPKDDEICNLLMERVGLAVQYYRERMKRIDSAAMIIK